MKQIRQDKNSKSLSYEELKKCKGFENLSEPEAEKEIEIVNKLTKILYLVWLNENQKD